MSTGDEPVDTSDGIDEARSAEQIRAEIEQTREQLGDTVEALAGKTDVKARAHEGVDAVRESVSETVGHARETVTESIGSAREAVTQQADDLVSRAREATPESASAGVQQVGATVQQRPVPFAALGAFAAGLLVGLLIGRR